MNQVETELLKLAASALFGAEYEILPEIDYSAVLNEAIAQSVFGLVYPLAKPTVSPDMVEKFEEQFFSYVMQNTAVENGHAAVHELMTEYEIPYVTLKGCASAKYYPEPELRCMGDVDFLVQKLDYDRVVELVKAEGFAPIEEDDNSHHQALRQGSIMWEVHHTVAGVPDGLVGGICRKKLLDIMETTEVYHTDSGVFLIPDAYHHGLVILLHTAEHIATTGVGLRHICDWAVFVNSMSEAEFIALFQKTFNEIGLWYFAKVLTALCMRYLGLSEKRFAVGIDEKLLADMMEDILDGGNFGKKDEDRYHGSMMTSKSSDDGGMVKNVFKTLNKRARIRMPITQKAPVLLPVGWIYVATNHLVMIKRGKRPNINLKTTLKKTSKRADLNKRYRLFEIM